MTDPDDSDGPPETQPAAVRLRPPGIPPAPPGSGEVGSGGGPAGYRAALLRAHLPTALDLYGVAMRVPGRDLLMVIADVEDARTYAFTQGVLFDNNVEQLPQPVRSSGGAIVILPVSRAGAKEALRRLSELAAETAETRRDGWLLVIVAGGGGFTFTLVHLPQARPRHGTS